MVIIKGSIIIELVIVILLFGLNIPNTINENDIYNLNRVELTARSSSSA